MYSMIMAQVALKSQLSAGAGSLAQPLEHLDEFLVPVAVAASQIHQLFRLGDQGPALRRTDDSDAATPAKFHQPLVAKRPQSAQDGVRVDPDDCRQVLCRRKSFPSFRFTVRDRPAQLAGYLLVEG